MAAQVRRDAAVRVGKERDLLTPLGGPSAKAVNEHQGTLRPFRLDIYYAQADVVPSPHILAIEFKVNLHSCPPGFLWLAACRRGSWPGFHARLLPLRSGGSWRGAAAWEPPRQGSPPSC